MNYVNLVNSNSFYRKRGDFMEEVLELILVVTKSDLMVNVKKCQTSLAEKLLYNLFYEMSDG